MRPDDETLVTVPFRFGDNGTRCARLARRLAGPLAKSLLTLSDYALLQRGLARALSMNDTIMKAAKMSGELGIRTLDLQADISELATRVTEQASTIQSIRGEADRLSEDGQSVAQAAQEARENATAARSVIDDSNRRLSGATANVLELIDQVTHIHAGLEAFTNALSTVGRVTGAIRDIASQTNLLALNATIEAARAAMPVAASP